MATYTFTTTDLDEQIVRDHVTRVNADIDRQNLERASAVPPLDKLPYATNESYLTSVVQGILAGWNQSSIQERAAKAVKNFGLMSSEQQTAVLSTLTKLGL